MKAVPSYTKILTLGSAYTENALVDEIVIQEKLDGSMFGFGVNEDGEIVMRSKGAVLTEDNHAEMFKQAVEYVMAHKDYLIPGLKDIYFYCEYLQKPKHNTLKYDKIPQNHLVLFDVLIQGKWGGRHDLLGFAEHLEIDAIPELWTGNMGKYLREKNEKGFSSPGDFMKRMSETTVSYLGTEIIEGVVIKNYGQTIMLGGQVFPLFTKFVRESFKERHHADWNVRQPKGELQAFIDDFKSEARWQKAVVHAKEQGKITESPKDIGPLIKAIQEDIKEEEAENIKQHLYKCFIDDIMRKSVAGFPQWYKDKLLEKLK